MTDPQLVGRALVEWLERAVNEGRIAPGAVRRDQIMRLAHSAAHVTEDDVADIAPDLGEWATEVREVMRNVQAAAPTPTEGNQESQEASTDSAPGDNPAVPSGRVTGESSQAVAGLTFATYEGGILGTAEQRVHVEFRDGQLTYSWQPLPSNTSTVVYRVLSNDTTRPQTPDEGVSLGATSDTWMVDAHTMRGATRTVQVWAYVGADHRSASQTQPTLWAESTVVAPVQEAQVQWDHGAMVASWSTAQGIDRVLVYRIPADEQGLIGPHEMDRYLVGGDLPHRFGLTDTDVVRGVTYVYRVVASADGQRAPSVELVAEAPYEARTIEDLRADIISQPDLHHSGTVSLEWTQSPQARVVVYRSDRMPQAGLVGRLTSVDALHENGLRDRVPNAPEPVDQNTRRMSRVQWPAGWTNAYFVPVSLTGEEECLPGQPVRVTGVPAPGRPDLAQRGDLQVVSFDWPESAGTVRVHTAARGADPTQVVLGSPVLEMDRERYVKDGGIRLTLPSTQDTDVILTAWVGGENRSAPVVVTASSRLEVRYTLSPQRRLGIGPIKYGRLVLWNEQGFRQTVTFVAVHNDKRLPLHAKDGQHLEIVPDDTPDAAPRRSIRPPSLTGGPEGAAYRVLAPKPAHGYVRVFVEPDLDQAARRRILVLDPPVTSLIWKPR